MKSIRHVIKRMKSEMNHIYASFQKTNHISDAKQRRYKSLSRRTQLLDGVLGLVNKKDKASLRSVFGEQLEYLPLILGECVFSEPFGMYMIIIFVKRKSICLHFDVNITMFVMNR